MHGGNLVGDVLKAHNIKFLFTLCGGHIAPILVGCKKNKIRVIDVRHEVNAVFAADAVARLTGIPGAAAVTAGPGVTNTITAVKNAQLAQSPVVIIGGATATALKGRGSLQDIDQMALFKPHVKWARSIKKVRDIATILTYAIQISQTGVPGPVFVEIPVDLLYPESLVKEWYGIKSTGAKTVGEKTVKFYLDRHVKRLFAGAEKAEAFPPKFIDTREPLPGRIRKAAEKIKNAERPVLLVGSQTMIDASEAATIAKAVENLGIPVYLSGMARGLLGKGHPLQLRHKRRNALKEADLVTLSGVPADFRLDYGRHIRKKTYLISANRSRREMMKNRWPNLGMQADPGLVLIELAEAVPGNGRWDSWLKTLRDRDNEREKEICGKSSEQTELLNPVKLCMEIENVLDENSILVADGGDFVATASYTVSPRGPLRWLDPGVFGTLGVGGGFALGAKLCNPEAEVWIIYGDGSAGYSLAEFDTFVRHNIPVIAVVGNDASWMQIAREQVEILEDDIGTVLRRTDYHIAAEGFGGKGFLLNDPAKTPEVLQQAKQAAKEGHPVLINAHLGKTDFRKGSISM
mgnify:CR=1 FL=1